jgi:Leucine-rich repeat (LRR) protein
MTLLPLLRRLVRRFSVRTICLSALLVGVSLGLFGRSVRIQREAVSALKQRGFVIRYEWDCADGELITAGEPPWPHWLVELLGVDCFGCAIGVKYPETGDLFRHLWYENGLANISGAKLNEGLSFLRGLRSIEWLELNHSPVTDAGLARLGEIQNIRKLNLLGSRVTDEGLVCLRGLSTLEILNLADTDVTDAGTLYLTKLDSLRNLTLAHSRITNAGVARLSTLARIRTLDLSGTNIDDGACDDLKSLSAIQELDLSFTNVTDAGIARLESLKQLQFLGLIGTRVTGSAIRKLTLCTPHLKVQR